MLVVNVVMWPGGNFTEARVEAVATLSLLGKDLTGHRRYRAVLFKSTAFGGPDGSDPARIKAAQSADVWKTIEVSGHDPTVRGIWDLLGATLVGVLGARLTSYRTGS